MVRGDREDRRVPPDGVVKVVGVAEAGGVALVELVARAGVIVHG